MPKQSMKPEIDRVEINSTTQNGKTTYKVIPHWKNVDRPSTTTFHLGEEKGLATRFASAITAGVFFKTSEISKDIHGKSFVKTESILSSKQVKKRLKEVLY